MKGGWAHRLTNDSDNPARLIEIDVQPNMEPERASCGLAASTCTDGQFGKTKEGSYATSTLFETPKVRLMKIELGTRGVFERHAHTGSEMLIPLTRVHLIDLPFDYASVEIGWENLLFSFTRGREETNVVVAPAHAPNMSYELGPVIAALEDKRYSDRYAIKDLRNAADLLQPHLQALNAAFSERDFPTIKQKL